MQEYKRQGGAFGTTSTSSMPVGGVSGPPPRMSSRAALDQLLLSSSNSSTRTQARRETSASSSSSLGAAAAGPADFVASGSNNKSSAQLHHELTLYRQEQESAAWKHKQLASGSASGDNDEQAWTTETLDSHFYESHLYNEYLSAVRNEWFRAWFKNVHELKRVVPMFFGGLGMRHAQDKATELAHSFWTRVSELIRQEIVDLEQSLPSASRMTFDEWGYVRRGGGNRSATSDSGDVGDYTSASSSQDSNDSLSSSGEIDIKVSQIRLRIASLKQLRETTQAALDEPFELEHNYTKLGSLGELERLVFYLRQKWSMPALCIVPGTLSAVRMTKTRGTDRAVPGDVCLPLSGTLLTDVKCKPSRDWATVLNLKSSKIALDNLYLGILLDELDRRLLYVGAEALAAATTGKTPMDETHDADDDADDDTLLRLPVSSDSSPQHDECGFQGPWPIWLCFEQ